jgi:carbon storage regulator CsrA
MGQLVLARKEREQILIGETLLTVVEIRGNRVILAMDAPAEVKIVRAEIAHLPPKDEPRYG